MKNSGGIILLLIIIALLAGLFYLRYTGILVFNKMPSQESHSVTNQPIYDEGGNQTNVKDLVDDLQTTK